MAARHRKMKHHHKAHGGKADGAEVASGNPEVIKEAEGKRRKRGGEVVARMSGGAARHRLDRPGRKRGGRVGADTAPLSSAHGHTGADSAPHSTVGPTENKD